MRQKMTFFIAIMIVISTVCFPPALADSNAAGPFERYAETVVVRIGSMDPFALQDDGFSRAEGVSQTGNLYADYLLERSNIQVETLWSVPDAAYQLTLRNSIASNNLPDVFLVQDESLLRMLVKTDMVADLTGTYETKAAPYIQAFYEDYGDDAFDAVTFDGRIMAVPDLNSDHQFNFVWVRKDWLDQLDLALPQTLEDCVSIAQAFLDAGLATIGFPCVSSVAGSYNTPFSMDPALNALGAYLRSWIYLEDGSIVYGSVQPEAREALAFLADLYQQGLLDSEFAVRDTAAISQNLLSGQFGICFGPWHLPSTAMTSMKEADPESNWVPVLAPLSSDGKLHPTEPQTHRNYLCVRKGYEHPEVVWELLNYAWLHSDDPRIHEIDTYYADRLGPEATVSKPWQIASAIMVQWHDAVRREGRLLQSAIDNSYDTTGLNDEMRRFVESSKAWLEDGDAAQWPLYAAHVLGTRTVDDQRIEPQRICQPMTSDTMASVWPSLQRMENDAIMKIILGEEPIAYFDTFVSNWYQLGGQQITNEINALYGVMDQ